MSATRASSDTDLMLDDDDVAELGRAPRSDSPPHYSPPDLFPRAAVDARDGTTFELAKMFAQKTAVSKHKTTLTLGLVPGCDPLLELGRALVAQLKTIPPAPGSGDVSVVRDVPMDSLLRMSHRLKQIVQAVGPLALEVAVEPGRDPTCELFRALSRKAVPLVPIEWLSGGDAAAVEYRKLVDIPVAPAPSRALSPLLYFPQRQQQQQIPSLTTKATAGESDSNKNFARPEISVRPIRRSRGKEPDADLVSRVDHIRLASFSDFLPAALKLIRGIGYACAFVDVFGTLVVPEARAYAMLDAHLEPMERAEIEMDCRLRDEDFDRVWAAEKRIRRAKVRSANREFFDDSQIMEKIPKSNGYAMTREDAVEVMGLLADATEGRLYYMAQAEIGVPVTTTMLVEMGFPLAERHVMSIDNDRTKGLQVRAILNKGAPNVIATVGMNVFVIDDSEIALNSYRDPEAFGDKILICALIAP